MSLSKATRPGLIGGATEVLGEAGEEVLISSVAQLSAASSATLLTSVPMEPVCLPLLITCCMTDLL